MRTQNEMAGHMDRLGFAMRVVGFVVSGAVAAPIMLVCVVAATIATAALWPFVSEDAR